MDAHILSEKLKKIWADNFDKRSGQLHKTFDIMDVVIKTDEGYRSVVAAVWNNDIKKVELVLDND